MEGTEHATQIPICREQSSPTAPAATLLVPLLCSRWGHAPRWASLSQWLSTVRMWHSSYRTLLLRLCIIWLKFFWPCSPQLFLSPPTLLPCLLFQVSDLTWQVSLPLLGPLLYSSEASQTTCMSEFPCWRLLLKAPEWTQGDNSGLWQTVLFSNICSPFYPAKGSYIPAYYHGIHWSVKYEWRWYASSEQKF